MAETEMRKGKLLKWPEKKRRIRRTRDQLMGSFFGLTAAEWRRWQILVENLPPDKRHEVWARYIGGKS